MNLARNISAATAASLGTVALLTVASLTGVVLGARGLYGNVALVLGPTPSTAGILVPGFLGHDVFNLVVGLPGLLGAVWLARRGSLVALLLWPGGLFYLLYTYAIYLVGAPFSGLFLLYALLVALCASGTISLVAAVDHERVRQQLEKAVPARLVGGLLIGLALATIAQDTSGAISTALAGRTLADPLARPVWAVDLSVEAPAVLLGGLLLWQRKPLGYATAAGLLLQYGLTPAALAFGLLLQAIVTASAVDWAAVVGVLVFAAVCFAPLAFFVRAIGTRLAGSGRTAARVAAPGARVSRV